VVLKILSQLFGVNKSLCVVVRLFNLNQGVVVSHDNTILLIVSVQEKVLSQINALSQDISGRLNASGVIYQISPSFHCFLSQEFSTIVSH
jgi:hypothetical protein